jgi:HK97 family phage portal protein
MGLLQRIWDGEPRQPAVNNGIQIETVGRGFDGYTTFGSAGTLPVPTEASVLAVSAVYGCVNLIAGAISALPVNLYNRDAAGNRDLRQNDELWWVLNEQFTGRWASSAGWEYLVQSLLIKGDGFAEIVRGPQGQVTGLEPINPDRVTVGVWPDGSRLAYRVEPDATYQDKRGARTIDQDDMLHIPGFGFNGLRGLSPLRYALRNTTAVASAAQDYSAAFFQNSARPDILLKTGATLDAKQAADIKGAWLDTYGGPNKAGGVAVLGSGTEIQQLTMSSEDAQLLGTRQFQIEEIARIYGVPPFMIGHNEKTTSWGSGVEAMGTGFVRYTLRQHLSKFECEINRKFFRRATPFAQFDTSELERADMKSMFEAYRVAVGRSGEPGWISTDEVRAKLNMKPTPGGDQLFKGVPDAQPAA